jgi:hypothetical protein
MSSFPPACLCFLVYYSIDMTTLLKTTYFEKDSWPFKICYTRKTEQYNRDRHKHTLVTHHEQRGWGGVFLLQKQPITVKYTCLYDVWKVLKNPVEFPFYCQNYDDANICGRLITIKNDYVYCVIHLMSFQIWHKRKYDIILIVNFRYCILIKFISYSVISC